MDKTQDQYAYRCLPMVIANASGWEILNPAAFTVTWNGSAGNAALIIDGSGPTPVSIFGSGILTFHAHCLFKTSPGWNLWVGGSPNTFKDGIAPLNGIIETDWSPFTFTMNWKVTRADMSIRFEKDEPIAFFFPIRRDNLDGIEPEFRPLSEVPEKEKDYREWSQSRNAFHNRMRTSPPAEKGETWQKHYYRGIKVNGQHGGAGDHRTRIRLKEFRGR